MSCVPLLGPAIFPIPGREGYYVSTEGHVYSTWMRFFAGKKPLLRSCGPKRKLQPFDRKGLKGEDTGYLSVQLGRGKACYVHRLVLETFVGPPPTPEHQACHENGDRRDNRLANLRWGTPKENAADRVRHWAEREEMRGAFDGLLEEG